MNRSRAKPMPDVALPVIPAMPGFFVISRLHDGADRSDKTKFFQAPIVAWALERDTYQPYPITLDGINVDSPCILQPDGSVERLGVESYFSVAEWLADLQQTSPIESNT